MTNDTNGTIGVTIQAPAAETVGLIERAERAGIPAVWLQGGGVGADPLTLFASAAVRTERVLMGSAIIPTWPRNAVFIAQQVAAIEAVAPGRLRLGVGPSTEGAMRSFGVAFDTPLTQLREYLTVLRALLHEGEVDFQGRHVRARARMPATNTPILASALNTKAFELCGELTDGAISWVCPPSYLTEQALPAMRRGAERAGRETPPLIMHVAVCVEQDVTLVREAAQRQIGAYPRFQFYRDMFASAGYPEAAEGLSDELVDALVVHGDEDQVAEGLLRLLEAGMGELLTMPLITGEDREGSLERSFAAIARAASETT